MDLPSAITEFADMLALGSSALDKLIERQKQDYVPATVEALLSESQEIAQRLLAIAGELRRHFDPGGPHS